MRISFYDAIQINSKLHAISWHESAEKESFIFERVKLDLGHYADELRTKFHRHQNLEMHLVLTGNIQLEVAECGETITIGENSFALFSPGSVHSINAHSDNMIKLGVRFDIGEHCHKNIQNILLGCGYAAGKLDQHTLKVLSVLIDQCTIYGCDTEAALRCIIIALIYDIARLIQLSDAEEHIIEKELNSFQPYVREAVLYIHENIQQSLCCQMVADHVGLSIRHLNRIMLAEMGIGVYQLIMRTKHNLARQLLLDTKLSIERISELMNFSSAYNFSHFFKRMEGVSPSFYRTDNKHEMS